jgi:hypothetical protein
MGRLKCVDHNLKPVATYKVAPHRYTYSSPVPDTFPSTYKEVLAAAPYKVGDVVYVIYGDAYTRAYISAVECARDPYDEWREYYKVHRETKKGAWAQSWYIVHPGYIQRGYQRAGEAPDVPS